MIIVEGILLKLGDSSLDIVGVIVNVLSPIPVVLSKW